MFINLLAYVTKIKFNIICFKLSEISSIRSTLVVSSSTLVVSWGPLLDVTKNESKRTVNNMLVDAFLKLNVLWFVKVIETVYVMSSVIWSNLIIKPLKRVWVRKLSWFNILSKTHDKNKSASWAVKYPPQYRITSMLWNHSFHNNYRSSKNLNMWAI